MTTTDPTPLAKQIAWEHYYLEEVDECSCGQDYWMSHALHIATVTERTVRERIEEEIAATWETFALPLPVNTFPLSEQKAYRFGYLWAVRIARGGMPDA